MRRKVVEGVNGGDTVSKGRRRASTFIEQQNCNRDMPNGEIDGQKRLKSKRNSLMIPGKRGNTWPAVSNSPLSLSQAL
jgi:hypothetical protein